MPAWRTNPNKNTSIFTFKVTKRRDTQAIKDRPFRSGSLQSSFKHSSFLFIAHLCPQPTFQPSIAPIMKSTAFLLAALAASLGVVQAAPSYTNVPCTGPCYDSPPDVCPEGMFPAELFPGCWRCCYPVGPKFNTFIGQAHSNRPTCKWWTSPS